MERLQLQAHSRMAARTEVPMEEVQEATAAEAIEALMEARDIIPSEAMDPSEVLVLEAFTMEARARNLIL